MYKFQRADYVEQNKKGPVIWSLYNSLMKNVPKENIIDLTIPGLGITSPDLIKLRQDCLTMKEAKFCLQVGIGGSFCLGSSVSNLLSFRIDNDPVADFVFENGNVYENTLVTKKWHDFSNKLQVL